MAAALSGEFAGGCDFRSGRLVHRVVRGIRHPWLLIDHLDSPALVAGAGEMIEPGHRAIVDGEGEAPLRLAAERKPDRGLDGAAMRHRDHVLPGMLLVDPFDHAADAGVEIHETLPARRRIVDRREPVAADLDRPAGEERGAVQSLPLAEMLFGQRALLLHVAGPGK